MKTTSDEEHKDAAELLVRYLGQVGFLLSFRGLTIAIDPYLTDSVDRLPGLPPGLWVRNYRRR